MSADILGANCDQCRSMVQCCYTSTETVRLIKMESPGQPPRLSHSGLSGSVGEGWDGVGRIETEGTGLRAPPSVVTSVTGTETGEWRTTVWCVH